MIDYSRWAEVAKTKHASRRVSADVREPRYLQFQLPSEQAELLYSYCQHIGHFFTHLRGSGVYVRQVDAAGSEVDEGHGDALPLQGGELVEVHRAELDVVDEVVWVGAAEAEDEVILVEQSDLLLQGVQGGIRCRRTAVSVFTV